MRMSYGKSIKPNHPSPKPTPKYQKTNMPKSFNIIIATKGRPSLKRMVNSIYPQLQEQDFLTILCDCKLNLINNQIENAVYKCKATISVIQNAAPQGFWGHGSRNLWQNTLLGDYFHNADDDDVYMPDAMDIIREYCTEQKVYVFRIYHQYHVPRDGDNGLYLGNISTQCGIIPNTGNLPTWIHKYGGDFDFYEALQKQYDVPFEYIDKFIYRIREY